MRTTYWPLRPSDGQVVVEKESVPSYGMPSTRRSLQPAGEPPPSVTVAVTAPDASDAVSTFVPPMRNSHDATRATPCASVTVLAGSTTLPGSDCGGADVEK